MGNHVMAEVVGELNATGAQFRMTVVQADLFLNKTKFLCGKLNLKQDIFITQVKYMCFSEYLFILMV